MGSNILFFNIIPFVVIEVRKIKSTPIYHVLHHTEKSFLTYMVKIYKQRGINIITILMNWELEFIRGNIPNLNLKIYISNEHILDIKQQIWIIKWWTCSTWRIITFLRIPRWIIKNLVKYIFIWINVFPPNISVSNTCIPRAIINGNSPNFSKHCKIRFGDYAQTHKDKIPTKSMETRNCIAIDLGPTANLQGAYRFLFIHKVWNIFRKIFTHLPTSDYIIDWVK